MKKYICFRFDVDTHICLKDGVPILLDIFKAEDAHCTFFVSMGKGFKRSYFIKEKLFGLKEKNTRSAKERFSVYYKIGLLNSLNAFFINPSIGTTYQKILKTIIQNGHELGLHGGKNHATWENDAHSWSEKQLCNEIEFGLEQFTKQDLPKPLSFASPCWKAPEKLNYLLEKLNFQIAANQLPIDTNLKMSASKLYHYPTNVIGKNKEIGFIENYRALGYTTEEILLQFSKQLDIEEPFKMVFDHPFYAGVHETKTLAAMIKIAKKKGYIVDSLRNIHTIFENEGITYISRKK